LEAASLLVAHYSKSGLMEKLPPQSSIWVQRAKDALQVIRTPFSERLPRRIRWRDVSILLYELNRLKSEALEARNRELALTYEIEAELKKALGGFNV
jgi:hypothetical protein